jgi:hypothetical protein
MRWSTIVRVVALLPALGLASARAREVKYIDLTNVSQRTLLRFPPEPIAMGTDDAGVGGGHASVGIGDGDAC